jgi:cell division protein FtsZ
MIADSVLKSGVQGITDLVVMPGLINLDFSDVRSVLQQSSSALMGIGTAKGEDRALRATEQAIHSPLLEASIDGAHGVLMLVQGASNLGLHEVDDAASMVQLAVNPGANVIWGCTIDDSLGDEIRITVIAAGFDGGLPRKRVGQRPVVRQPETFIPPVTSSNPVVAPVVAPVVSEPAPAATAERLPSWFAGADESEDYFADVTSAEEVQEESAPKTTAIHIVPERTVASEDFGDDLDIPDFLK